MRPAAGSLGARYRASLTRRWWPAARGAGTSARAGGLIAAAIIGTAVLGAAIAPSAMAAQAGPAQAAVSAGGALPRQVALPAHATLVTTSPTDATVVPAEPGRVTAGFDQPVGASPDSLVVYTPAGQRADTGGTQHDGPLGIAVTLTPGLGQGSYTAEWHVVSADSHEVQGAFTFSVGAPSATRVPAIKSPDATTVATMYAVTRWLEYAFYALLAGAVAFLIACWPAGARRKGVPGLVVTGWAGLIGSTLAALLLQGPYSQNVGLGLLLNPAPEVATLHTPLGNTLQARQVLTVVAAIAATATIRRLPGLTTTGRVAAGGAWAVLTAAIAATWAVADHASTGFQVPLAIAADIVHLIAMAVWGGGLVMLAAFTLRGPANSAAALAVRRFSPVALGCVAALAATGGYMAWRLIGTWGALFGTTYGLLVIAKSAGSAVLVCLGYLARRFIHRRLLSPGVTTSRAPRRVPDGRATISGAPRIDELAATTTPRAAAAGRAQAGYIQAAPPADATVPGDRTVEQGSSQLALAAITAGHAMAPDATQASAGGPPGFAAHPRDGDQPDGSWAGDGRAGDGRAGDEPPRAGRPGDGEASAQPVPSMRDLRLSVMAEVGVVALVLAATAVLVNTATGRESYAPPAGAVEQFDTGGPNGAGTVHVTVTPARLGGNQVTMTFDTPAGRAFVPAQVQAALFLPARGIGPLPVTLAPAGPGPVPRERRHVRLHRPVAVADHRPQRRLRRDHCRSPSLRN